MPLKLSTRTIDDVSIVDCSGRIVFGDEASALREAVKGLLDRPRSIVINLEQVNYIDSGGLGTLVGLYTSARNSGGNISLACLNNRVIDLLQVTKLLTVFEVHDAVEKAVAAHKSGETAGAA